jgi:hypothetical protein
MFLSVKKPRNSHCPMFDTSAHDARHQMASVASFGHSHWFTGFSHHVSVQLISHTPIKAWIECGQDRWTRCGQHGGQIALM